MPDTRQTETPAEVARPAEQAPVPRHVPASRALAQVRFLTVAEVAVIMRVSKMTIYRLVRDGELESVRVGRSFRIPERAVTSYLRGAFIAQDRPEP